MATSAVHGGRIGGAIATVAVGAFAVGEATDVFAYGLGAVVALSVLIRGLVVRDVVLLEHEWAPWAAAALNVALVVFIIVGPFLDESESAGWRSAVAAVLLGVLTWVRPLSDEPGELTEQRR